MVEGEPRLSCGFGCPAVTEVSYRTVKVGMANKKLIGLERHKDIEVVCGLGGAPP